MKKIIPFLTLLVLLMQACGGEAASTETAEPPLETAVESAEVATEA